MSLNKTKIPWTDLTWNPVTGCKHGCSYCYARKIATRFNGTKAWPNGFEPTFHPERLKDFEKFEHIGTVVENHLNRRHIPKGSKVFVCSMGDLFGDWVPYTWVDDILTVCEKNLGITFQFLTKNPKEYKEYNFPGNCWLGMTLDGTQWTLDAYNDFMEATRDRPNIRFLSIEPYLPGLYPTPFKGEVDWVIIGAMTGPGAVKAPDAWALIHHVREIGAALFLKDSLGWSEKIQEYPTKRTGVVD